MLRSDDGGFERFVIFCILERTDHRLGGQAVADSIAAGALLTFFGYRIGAFVRVAAVGLDLPEERYWGRAAIFGFVL